MLILVRLSVQIAILMGMVASAPRLVVALFIKHTMHPLGGAHS